MKLVSSFLTERRLDWKSKISDALCNIDNACELNEQGSILLCKEFKTVLDSLNGEFEGMNYTFDLVDYTPKSKIRKIEAEDDTEYVVEYFRFLIKYINDLNAVYTKIVLEGDVHSFGVIQTQTYNFCNKYDTIVPLVNSLYKKIREVTKDLENDTCSNRKAMSSILTNYVDSVDQLKPINYKGTYADDAF